MAIALVHFDCTKTLTGDESEKSDKELKDATFFGSFCVGLQLLCVLYSVVFVIVSVIAGGQMAATP